MAQAIIDEGGRLFVEGVQFSFRSISAKGSFGARWYNDSFEIGISRSGCKPEWIFQSRHRPGDDSDRVCVTGTAGEVFRAVARFCR